MAGVVIITSEDVDNKLVSKSCVSNRDIVEQQGKKLLIFLFIKFKEKKDSPPLLTRKDYYKINHHHYFLGQWVTLIPPKNY